MAATWQSSNDDMLLVNPASESARHSVGLLLLQLCGGARASVIVLVAQGVSEMVRAGTAATAITFYCCCAAGWSFEAAPVL